MVYLSLYHRVVDISNCYLTGYFYFYYFEIQQVQECWKKNEIGKTYIYLNRLGNHS